MKLFSRKSKKPNLILNKFRSLLIVGLLGWVVYLVGEVIDNIYAGQFLNETALSAVQIVIPFYSFICFVSVLCSVGFGFRYTNLMGKGEKDKAYKIAGLGIIFSLASAVIIGVLMLTLKTQLLSIFNLDPTSEIYMYASDYYNWYIGVAFVYPLYMLVYRLASQDGDALWTVMSDISQVVVNAVISAILIKTMGIQGLGLGTFISMIVGMLMVLVHYLTKRNSVKFRPYFSFKDLGTCIRLGLSTGLATLCIAIVDIIMNIFIVNFKDMGSSYLASYTIINFVLNFTSLFTCVPDSATPFLSLSYGSNNVQDFKYCAKLQIKWAIIISLASSVVMCALCLFIPPFFGISQDSSQFFYSWLSVLIIAPTFICTALMVSICSAYLTKNESTPGIVFELLSNLIFPIALPIAFAYAFGYIGFIIGFAVTAILSAAIVAIMLLIRNKSHRIMEYPKVDEVQITEDFFVNRENLNRVFDDIKTRFEKMEINRKTIIFLIGLLEDSYNVVMKNNPNKLVTNHLTICVGKDKIRLINQNDGRVLSNEEKKKTLDDTGNAYFNFFSTNSQMKWNVLVSYNFANIEFDRKRFN